MENDQETGPLTDYSVVNQALTNLPAGRTRISQQITDASTDTWTGYKVVEQGPILSGKSCFLMMMVCFYCIELEIDSRNPTVAELVKISTSPFGCESSDKRKEKSNGQGSKPKRQKK